MPAAVGPVEGYAVAVAVVVGMGGFALTADLYMRRGALRRLHILDIYAGVLAVAAVVGAAALAGRGVLGAPNPVELGLAVPAGIAVGFVARSFDRRVVRAAARRRPAPPPPPRGPGPGRTGRTTPTEGALLLGGTSRRPPPNAATWTGSVDPSEFALRTVIVVAVLEELFYRGVLAEAARLPGGFPAVVLLAATVAVFAFAHIAFGWIHVLAKAPLGALGLAAALALGTVVPAVVAHVWFNLSVWRDIKRTGGVVT